MRLGIVLAVSLLATPASAFLGQTDPDAPMSRDTPAEAEANATDMFEGMPPRWERMLDQWADAVNQRAPTFLEADDPMLPYAREAAARGLFSDTSREGKRALMEYTRDTFADADDQVRFLIEGAALDQALMGTGVWTTVYGLRSAPGGLGGLPFAQGAEHFAYAYEQVESGQDSQALMHGGVVLHAGKDLTVDNLRPAWRSITNLWDRVIGDGTQQQPVNWDYPSSTEMKWGYLGVRVGGMMRDGEVAEAQALVSGAGRD